MDSGAGAAWPSSTCGSEQRNKHNYVIFAVAHVTDSHFFVRLCGAGLDSHNASRDDLHLIF